MSWYPRVRAAIHAALPGLLPTRAANLALLVCGLLAKRTLCLSEMARAYPTPATRRMPAPKHDLLHRLRRLWRFLGNGRVDPVAAQPALVPYTLDRLGGGRPGLAIDWTMFDATLPSGRRRRYQVLRIAAPCRGRAVPLLQLAYDRDRLPAGSSQNRLEEDALWAVVAAPPGNRPVVLADRGFGRADFLAALQRRGLDYVVRPKRGVWLTAADGRRWKLGEEGLARGQVRWLAGVRYGRWHSPPSELRLDVALCWPVAKGRANRRRPPTGPRYLATSLGSAARAAAWYRRRGGRPPGDRAGLQGRQVPLRTGPGPGRLPGAADPAAGGADAGARLAGARGVARPRGAAARLARPRGAVGTARPAQPGAGPPRRAPRPAACLPAERSLTRWMCVGDV